MTARDRRRTLRAANRLAAIEAEMSCQAFAGDSFAQAMAAFARSNRERAERALDHNPPKVRSLGLFGTEEE